MAEEIQEEPKWYVLHTFSGYENIVMDSLYKVIENNGLQNDILEVQIPMEDAIEEKNGKRKVVQRKMFPLNRTASRKNTTTRNRRNSTKNLRSLKILNSTKTNPTTTR